MTKMTIFTFTQLGTVKFTVPSWVKVRIVIFVGLDLLTGEQKYRWPTKPSTSYGQAGNPYCITSILK